jgi:hypothetical protein
MIPSPQRMASEEIWHLVEGRREDGLPSMFRIRDLPPRRDQPKIFVAELPYLPATRAGAHEARLPDAAAHRRIAMFEEQWVRPACTALGWTFVATKLEDGSAFIYLYGAGDTLPVIERLSPFDGALGFFDEDDPDWEEYAALHELLDQARSFPAQPVEAPRAKKATTDAKTRKRARAPTQDDR